MSKPREKAAVTPATILPTKASAEAPIEPAKQTRTPAAASPGELIVLKLLEGETDQQGVARMALNPANQAANTRRLFDSSFGHLSVNALAEEIQKQCDRVASGDLQPVESMLMAQAISLDAIYHAMAARAYLHLGTHLPGTEAYLRLAMKAQGQCRTTLEALGEIKNPKSTAFIKQQNNAGNMQVNNGAPPARTGATENRSNELLGVTHEQGERLDAGAPAAAGGADPAVASMGEVDRAQKSRRKGSLQSKRHKARVPVV